MRCHRAIPDEAQDSQTWRMHRIPRFTEPRYALFVHHDHIPIIADFWRTYPQGDTLRIGLQKGLLSLPSDTDTPVICVGPGTGVAPMRALLEKRIHVGATSMSRSDPTKFSPS